MQKIPFISVAVEKCVTPKSPWTKTEVFLEEGTENVLSDIIISINTTNSIIGGS